MKKQCIYVPCTHFQESAEMKFILACSFNDIADSYNMCAWYIRQRLCRYKTGSNILLQHILNNVISFSIIPREILHGQHAGASPPADWGASTHGTPCNRSTFIDLWATALTVSSADFWWRDLSAGLSTSSIKVTQDYFVNYYRFHRMMHGDRLHMALDVGDNMWFNSL